jgi:uncharacterized protein (DUF488 family)
VTRSPRVFTVGHGTRTAEELVAVLQDADITVVVDVRRFPGSRRHPQFGREALADTLAAAGIGYEWQGEALGGRRSRSPASRHTALRQAAFAGYADHMDTDQFRKAVQALRWRAAAGERPAVLCAETVWWRCHRRMIADALLLQDVAVTHLLDVGRRQEHSLHPDAHPGPDGWPVYGEAPLPGL